MSGLAHGRIDNGGRLVEAEPPLARLQESAGAGVGDPIAVPQIATLARLAQRLGILVSRCVIAADGADDLDLWVEARPDQSGVALAIGGWARRPSRPGEDAGERVHDLMRARGDWVWETGPDLRLTSIGAAGAEAGLGQPFSRFFRFNDSSEGGMPILEALAARTRFEGQDATVRGSGEPVRLTGVPLLDGGGRFAGYRGNAFRLDMTEANAASNPLDALSARLERALRGPLVRIVEQAETIGTQPDGPLQRDYADYAQDIAGAGRHLLGVIGDLVDLQAIERDDFRPRAETVDLADLARRAAALLKGKAAEHRVIIDAPGPQDHWLARGDAGRIVQILVNLIGNAVRFTPAGEPIRVRGTVQADRAAITVFDNGPGIAPADQERIFNKFTRLDQADGGSGLGLYIARRLARAMGGDISLESAPGQGARFTLGLPKAG